MKKILILILLLLIPLSFSYAQPGFNARSMGMGGAYHGMARGADVSFWNPANLIFPDHPHVTVDFLSFGFSIGNSALDVGEYNDYFSQEFFDKNERWDAADKQNIIAFFNKDFTGFFRSQFTSAAVSYEHFAFAVNHFAYSNARTPQESFELLLNGISTEPIELTNFGGEGIAGTEIAMSFAKVLHPDWDFMKFFSVGASFKYYIGHGYYNLEDAYGTVMSSTDSLKLNGYYKFLKAAPSEGVGKSGDGVGFDIGGAAIISDQLSVGLSLMNIVGFVNFGEVEGTYEEFTYNEPGLKIDNLDDFGEFIDEVEADSITTVKYTTETRYQMPKYLIMSANWKCDWWLTVEADYQQGLNNTAGCTTIPRLALGTEINYIDWLPIRVGYSMGGIQKTTYAIGFGLDFAHYDFDFGIAAQRGIFNYSKGINLAISHRLEF